MQAAQHAPVIAWDGKLLTIDAENSSLSDILLAIRSHTGASIEMPASTNRERIAIHLGPAPVREVLASLLYGTSFNYVIQSSEDDVTALGKVIITASDGDLSDDTVVADTDSNPSNLSNPSNASNPSNPKRRMMPGYAAPGKRDFEVSMSSATDDSSSNLAEAPAAEPSAPASDQPSTAAATDSNATSAQPDGRPVPSTADANDSSSSSDSPAVVAAGPSGSAAGTIAGNSSSGGSSEATPAVSQMEQQLQNMYQKRQQLQAQQNRAAQTPAQ